MNEDLGVRREVLMTRRPFQTEETILEGQEAWQIQNCEYRPMWLKQSEQKQEKIVSMGR